MKQYIIDILKFDKKIEKYVEDFATFSVREKEETVEEIHDIVVACSHPYQSERDKVLELLRLKYVEFLNHPCPELADKYDHCCDVEWCGLCTLDEVLAELRAGEP